jgi:hypothetical protein
LLRGLGPLAISLFVLGVGRSDADPITLSASFVASGFRNGAPVDPVTGTYAVTFDNDFPIVERTTGITLSNLNIDIDGPPAFFYDPTTDLLILGSTFNGLLTVFRDTNDFFLTVGHASTHPIDVQLVYAQRGSDIFIGGAALRRTPVPEPSTLALVLSGALLGALGSARVNGRRSRSYRRSACRTARDTAEPREFRSGSN